MIKQWTKAHVKVINFHNTSIAHLVHSVRWSNSKFKSLYWSDQLSQYTDWALHHDAYKQLKTHLVCSTKWSNSERKLTSKWSTFTIQWLLIWLTQLNDQTANLKSLRWSDQLSQYTDQALHRDAHKQFKTHLICLIKWSNSKWKFTLKWSTFTIHWSLI